MSEVTLAERCRGARLVVRHAGDVLPKSVRRLLRHHLVGIRNAVDDHVSALFFGVSVRSWPSLIPFGVVHWASVLPLPRETAVRAEETEEDVVDFRLELLRYAFTCED